MIVSHASSCSFNAQENPFLFPWLVGIARETCHAETSPIPRRRTYCTYTENLSTEFTSLSENVHGK